MTSTTIDRIVELWPSLPEKARQTILDIAERTSAGEADLRLTADQLKQIEQSRDDFKNGRYLDADAYGAHRAEFFRHQGGKIDK